MSFMHRLVAAALALSAPLTGFAGVHHAGPTSRQLRAELLTASQLPTGWAVMALSTGSGGSASFCGIASSGGLPKATGAAIRAFHRGGQPVPELVEALAGYRVPPKTAFAALHAKLDACHHIVLDGVTLKLSKLAFPRLGTASMAFKGVGQEAGVPLVFDWVFVLKGQRVMGVDYGNIRSNDVHLLAAAARAAAARLPR